MKTKAEYPKDMAELGSVKQGVQSHRQKLVLKEEVASEGRGNCVRAEKMVRRNIFFEREIV